MKQRKTVKAFCGFRRVCQAAAMVCCLVILSGCAGMGDGPRFSVVPDSSEGPATSYLLKQNFWAFKNDYVIRDEGRNPLFIVKSKLFSFGNKLSLLDLEGRELIYISQRALSLAQAHRFYRGKDLLGTIKMKLVLIGEKYVLDVPGPDDYVIRGDLLSYNYVFLRQGRTVATISRNFFGWADSYRIDIAPGEDDPLILACAVVIDLVGHNDENSKIALTVGHHRRHHN